MLVHQLGMQSYEVIWQRMKHFTQQRTMDTTDELWLLEHEPVYTQGQAGKPEHILNPQKIPIVQSDRGGQVTYHGPGQLVGYTLIDIARRKLGIRTMVCWLEKVLLTLLASYDIHAEQQSGAPGVYVAGRKIASIGLRVKNGCTYHGIALNVDLDLIPFQGINPCGYHTLEMTRIKDFCPEVTMADVKERFTQAFLDQFAIREHLHDN